MSRCFPYPPPGYEAKPRSEHDSLLRKEKHKEKKHKEKWEKRKREGKGKDKDRKKDKHKEKREKKEKHRDKRRDRNKDKNEYSGTQKNDDPPCNERPTKSKQDRGVKDNGLTNELVSQILSQERQASHTISSISGSFPQNIEGFGAAGCKEKGRDVNGVVEESSHTTQCNHGMAQQNDQSGYPNKRKKYNGLISKNAMQNEKSLPAGSAEKHSSSRHGRNGVGLPQEGLYFAQRSSGGIQTTHVSEAGRGSNNRVALSPNALQRTEQANERVEVSSSAAYGKRVSMDIKAIAEKGHGRADCFGTGHWIHTQMDRPLEQSKDGTIEGKANKKEEGNNYENRVGDKDRNHDGKKRKGENKHREKEKDKKGDKKKKYKKLVALGESNNHIGDLMHSAPLNEKFTCDDIKKRKDLEVNGYLHEHGTPTTKLPRMSPSKPPWENGRTLQDSQRIMPNCSMKPVAADRLQDSKECHINGITKVHYLDDIKDPVSSFNSNSDKVTSKPPHPDSKYLSQIYSVPAAMDDCIEYDNQGWLFYGDRVQQKGMILEAAKSPQVWDEAQLIEPADIIALPYVVPL